MNLESLTYMSTAVHLVTRSELEHLLMKARARNLALNVSGVLLYSEGSFLQCIEGTPEALNDVFGHICADPLHHHIFELLRDPVEEREFAEWDMAFRSTGPDHIYSSTEDELTDRLAAPESAGSATRQLLSAFWNGGMGSRYQAALAGHTQTRR